ncbi:MAG: diguanylate cyclase [Candidatus Brocadiales bacterium]
MKIKTKLITGFSSLMILLLVVNVWAYLSLNKVSNSTSIFEEKLLQLDLVSRLQLAMGKMLTPLHGYSIHGNPAEKEKFDIRYTQTEKIFASLEKTNLTEEEKNTFMEAKAMCAEIKEKAFEILNLEAPIIGNALYVKPMEQMDTLAENLVKKIDALNQNAHKTATKTIFQSKTSTHNANKVLFYCALIILVNVSVVGFLIYLSIGKPIKQLQEGAELVIRGKLDHRVDLRSQDELKDLADIFNKMVGSLEKSIIDVKDEKSKLETVLHNIGDGVVAGDAKYNLVFMNPVAEKILGKRYKDLKGKGFLGCYKESDKLMKMLENDQLPVSATVNYGPKTLYINATSIKDADGNILGYTMILRDVTEQERLRKKLEERAIKDGLTGAYNYTYFQEHLGYEFEKSKRYNTPLSLILVDIDYFKNFNDMFGHQLGDEVLVTLTRILKDNLRQVDIVTRYGGEEFALILPNTENKECFHLAERLRIKTECHEIKGTDNPLRITISIGIATFHGTNFDNKTELLKSADDALYKAKRNGRNRIIEATPISA